MQDAEATEGSPLLVLSAHEERISAHEQFIT